MSCCLPKFRAVFAALLLLLTGILPARAAEPGEILPNPQMEARARAISAELRCPVCQGENIDDSAAPLAHDLRVLVRQRLQAGDTDAQVLDFMAARYGRSILLKPPFRGAAALLWLFPPALLIIAAVSLSIVWRRAAGRRAERRAALKNLTPQEQAKLDEILSEGRQ